jgi:hypothetical protein
MKSLILKSEGKKIFEGNKLRFEFNIMCKADIIEMGFEGIEWIQLNPIGFTRRDGGCLEIYGRQLRVRGAVPPLLHTPL